MQKEINISKTNYAYLHLISDSENLIISAINNIDIDYLKFALRRNILNEDELEYYFEFALMTEDEPDIVEFFIENGVSPSCRNNIAIRRACEYDKYNIAYHLINHYKNDIDVHVEDEYAFRLACANGHYRIVRLLYTNYDDINVCALDSYAFVNSVINNHLDIVRWLVTISDVNIHSLTITDFENACKNCSIECISLILDLIKNESHKYTSVTLIFNPQNNISRQSEMIKLLLDNNIIINSKRREYHESNMNEFTSNNCNKYSSNSSIFTTTNFIEYFNHYLQTRHIFSIVLFFGYGYITFQFLKKLNNKQ